MSFCYYVSLTLNTKFCSFTGNPLLCGDWVGSICHPYTQKTRGARHLFEMLLIPTICLFLYMKIIFCVFLQRFFQELPLHVSLLKKSLQKYTEYNFHIE